MSGLRWWGPKGGQGNALYLSMSDVVTSMGDMGEGGDHTKREHLCQKGQQLCKFDKMPYRSSIETGVVAYR